MQSVVTILCCDISLAVQENIFILDKCTRLRNSTLRPRPQNRPVDIICFRYLICSMTHLSFILYKISCFFVYCGTIMFSRILCYDSNFIMITILFKTVSRESLRPCKFAVFCWLNGLYRNLQSTFCFQL